MTTTGTPHVLRAALFAVFLGAAATFAPLGVQTASAAPQVVLGAPMGGTSVGYGTEQPVTISLGSCANAISHITWDSWGGPIAQGAGTACAQTGTPPQYTLVASDLGPCQGILAYRTLQISSNVPQSICG